MQHDFLSVGIDLGGTKIFAVVSTPDGNVLGRFRIITPANDGVSIVIQALLTATRGVLRSADVDAGNIKSFGVAAAGLCEQETGVVTASPNLKGWVDVPLRTVLTQELGMDVAVFNDANAAAFAEHAFGAGRGIGHLVYLGLGTGIGAGVILDGDLYTGSGGSAAELGHMIVDVTGPFCACGNRGCLEAFVSGPALVAEMWRRIRDGERTSLVDIHQDFSIPNKISTFAIHRAAQQGDSLSRNVLEWGGFHLGVGLVNILHIFNPDMIVVGGGLANLGHFLLNSAFNVVQATAFRFPSAHARIVTASLGQESGAIGAAALAYRAATKSEAVKN